ncbi:MAG: xanthine dehydrogenase family protein molybdopterin-binding subunit [Burkholderiaceae bacterium]|jgi:isoquinoline 1-oxidoreductase beta subunit
MNNSELFNLSRRHFLKGSAGLTLGFMAPLVSHPVFAATSEASTAAATGTLTGTPAWSPNPFIRVTQDNTVTVILKHIEMGQGSSTGLPTLVAEEMDADWSQIRVEGAPADTKRYANLLFGIQGTGGSTAMANSFDQMRQAGAAARSMLIAAAADQWRVPREAIVVKKGVISHPASKRSVSFGQLAVAAGKQPVPKDVKLKEPKDWVYIGKYVPRKDSVKKTTGTAVFTQDIKLSGMLTAVVSHPPRFGSKVKSFNADKARSIAGVIDVVRFETPATTGVAVLANDFWTAKKGRDALVIEWDETQAFRQGSDEIMEQYKKLAQTPGASARNDGDAKSALAKASKTVSAQFEFPYLAHATMEPMNCVAQVGADSCEIWNGEQFQTIDQGAVAAFLGLKPEQVSLNMLYAGGSFGRRANLDSDYVLEAVAIAKASGKSVPVKLVWTREEDMKAGHYRPMYFHTIEAGLDAGGNVVAWQQRIVGQSIMAGGAFEKVMVKDGVDSTSVEGAATMPYAIPNLAVDLHTTNSSVKVPIQWWRSVGSTHTAFSTEVMMDELAIAAGKDPVALRLALLEKHPRHAGVLKLAAQKAGWGQPLPKGRGRGIAVHEAFHTYVAEVAEVTVNADGTFKVDRVVCAVDCGIAVNPDVIRAQMEGGIGYGLSAALSGRITLRDGVVEQSNFNDYLPLRMNQMPKIEVYIVDSTEKPTGVGEPGTPVVAPAVVNALYAATGKRVYNLPIDPALLKT